jgi:ATP-dependent RNA helicase RhlE
MQRTSFRSRGNNNRFRPNNNHFNRQRRASPLEKVDPSIFVQKGIQEAVPVYVPVNSFNDFSLVDQLLSNVIARGYKNPTPIQDKVIPLIVQNRDVIGIANTGTGKTAAFLLPLINKVSADRSNKVLIVAPTRELAVQINEELRLFTPQMNIWSAVCIGGVSMSRQINELRRNPNFVIGTPGRLMDLERQGKIRFNNYQSIVLDEVDRMLDMGFINDIRMIISKLPLARQSLFFSATMPEKTKQLAQSFLRNPIQISVATSVIPSNVDQDIVKLNGRDKVDVLHDLLIMEGFEKVLVFGRTKHGINKLEQTLTQRGFKIATIHGNKSQSQRQRALIEFKENRIKILLATDVASRGLDIDNVTHVINYDLPESYEDYIHRIGRTGRVDKKGKALTFVN